MSFTAEELAAMAAADAEIEAGFRLEAEDFEQSARLDRTAADQDLDPAKLRRRQRRNAWRKAHRDEINAYRRAYYAAHRQELTDYFRGYRADHREEINARQRRYDTNHREEIKVRQRAYRAEHREELNAKRRAWYARKKAEAAV